MAAPLSIDNLVTRFDRPAEFPSEWVVVTLRRPLEGRQKLFANEEVSWNMDDWIVHEVRSGGTVLVLRPT